MNDAAAPPANDARSERSNAPRICGTLLLAWLIPGAGFLAHRRIGRGLALFCALNATFAIGLAMDGGVVWPPWDWRDPNSGFNIVNNLTFILQMGSGLPALASLWAQSHGSQGWLALLAANPSRPLFDLSSFYLLVAGALNYFVVCNTYDRLFGASAAPAAPPSQERKKD